MKGEDHRSCLQMPKKDGPCWLGRQSIQLWCRGEWMQWNGSRSGLGQRAEPGAQQQEGVQGVMGASEGPGGTYSAQRVELGQCSRPGYGTLEAIARRSPTKLPWGMQGALLPWGSPDTRSEYNLRRGPINLPSTMVKNSTNEIQV